MRKTLLKNLLPLACITMFSTFSLAESITIEHTAYCSGGIDGSGSEYLKICARNSAAYTVRKECKEIGGVITGKINSGNPFFPCESIGDMTKACEGYASGSCYLR